MWFLALRHLTSRKRQTLITVFGIGLGVMAFVAFSNIMLGFQEYIIDQLVNNDSHVRISPREEVIEEHSLDTSFDSEATHIFWIQPPFGNRNFERIDNPLAWFEKLDHDNRVLAYSPQLQTNVFFTSGGVIRAGRMVGADPYKQIRVSNIQHYIVKGDFLDLGSGGNRLIAGDGLLRKLGLRVGNTVLVSTAKGSRIPFKIIGSFHLGIVNFDDSMAFSNLAAMQTVAGMPSQISDIAIRLTDVNEALNFSRSYANKSRDKIQSWDQANASFLSVFEMQNIIRIFITTAIMIVAAFGIYNILSILVNQKRKEIGILRSMGFDEHDIRNLFLLQGLMLGLAGGLLGLLVGHFVSMFMGTLQIGGMIEKMKISYNPQIYISGFLEAVLASAVSSYLPARSAGKLKPIDVVRSGE
jgi:lipoprotein-releasing system permease protein